MKKFWLFLPLIAGCTGTSEPPTLAWLAVGSGTQINFYDANGFRPLGGEPLLAHTWELDSDLADLALFDNRLWLLLENRLVSQPLNQLEGQPEFDLEWEFPEGIDCTGGYLRPGEDILLAVCQGIPFAATALNLERLPDPPVREDPSFALGPDDILIYLTNDEIGVYWDPDELDQTSDLEPEYDDFDLLDFRYDLAGNRGYALFTQGSGLAAQARMLPVQISAFLNQPPDIGFETASEIEEFEPRKLSLNQEIVLGYGKGFAQFQPQTTAVINSTVSYEVGVVGDDGFLYLAQGNRIDCYNYREDNEFQDGQSNEIDLVPEALILIPLD